MKTAPEVVIDETKASPELVRAIKKAVDYLLQGAHYWRDGVPAPLDQWQPLYEHLQSVQEHAATRTALQARTVVSRIYAGPGKAERILFVRVVGTDYAKCWLLPWTM